MKKFLALLTLLTLNLNQTAFAAEQTVEKKLLYFGVNYREIRILTPEVPAPPTKLTDYTLAFDVRWGVVYFEETGNLELYCGTKSFAVIRVVHAGKDIKLTVQKGSKTANPSPTEEVLLTFRSEVNPERIWVTYVLPEDMENAIGALTGKVRRGEVKAPMLEKLLAETTPPPSAK